MRTKIAPCLAAALWLAGCSPTGSPTRSSTTGGGGISGRAQLTGIHTRPSVAQQAVSGDIAKATLEYARAERAALGLSQLDDFATIKVHAGLDGLQHVRLQQLHAGIKVWGADTVVHTSGAKIQALTGNVVIGVTGLDLTPSLSVGSAMTAAKADYGAQAKAADPLAYARESSELVILPQKGNIARLAWHVVFFTELQAGIKPGLWNYFVDAHDGALLYKFNAIHTAVQQASGPGGNAKVPRTWTDSLDVESSGTGFVMSTTKLETTDMNHGTSGQGTDVTSPTLNFNDAPIDDAHGFAEITVNMLNEWFGYNSIDNMGFKIISRVHYGTSYENAFWDGQEMTYGDGASTFYPLSGALDVVAHEIDHGFTSNHSNLTYSGMSGGMNESFSDIAGTAAKFYFDPSTATFDLGGDVFKQPNEALRYMCDPKKDGASIDNAKDYTDFLDVHYTSGVMNKAFCRAAKRLSSGSPDGAATATGVQRAAKAWYLANANYWTSSSTFTQGCKGVLDAATSLQYTEAEIAALNDSWKDVGVTCDGTEPPPPPPPPPGMCAHEICSTGSKLESGCDPCVTKICAQDGFCCSNSWDSICVNEVSSICGLTCGSPPPPPPPPPMCEHPICQTGSKLESTCDPCVTKICTQDSFCCASSWDSLCVGEVKSICGQTCGQ